MDLRIEAGFDQSSHDLHSFNLKFKERYFMEVLRGRTVFYRGIRLPAAPTIILQISLLCARTRCSDLLIELGLHLREDPG
jgi:hypothetical protein